MNYIYRHKVNSELEDWKAALMMDAASEPLSHAGFRKRMKRIIPIKVNDVITSIIKTITKATLSVLGKISNKKQNPLAVQNADELIKETIYFYSSSAGIQGAITGVGGVFSSFLDLPLWLSIKMKMLFEIAEYYGYDPKCPKEKLFILNILQLTFGDQKRKPEIYNRISAWNEESVDNHPLSLGNFDWKRFQEEYRYNLDFVKMFQMIPILGAVVGACTNLKLTYRLGKTAMNAFRLRIINEEKSRVENDFRLEREEISLSSSYAV